MVQENLNPFEISQRQFDTAAEKIGLDDGMREVLRNPKRQLIVSVPTLMDDGSVKVFTGLPRPAQHRARPRQGRHPLPPQGHPGRGQGAGLLDDLEVRDREHPLRRRQGRRGLRSQEDVPRRAGAHDAPLRVRDLDHHRARPRHPRSRRLHRRPDHGLDHGHLLHDHGLLVAGRRDRQADVAGRQRGPQRSHRARRALLHPRSLRDPEEARARSHGGRPGLRQRGRHRGAPAARGRRPGGGGVRQQGRRLPEPRPRPGAGGRAQAADRVGRGLQGRGAHHQRRADRGEVRRAGAGRAREPDHPANASPRACPRRGRGRQRPHHAGRRPRPARPRRLRGAGHPLQRGRRHRLLLRMGPEPAGLLLGRDRR